MRTEETYTRDFFTSTEQRDHLLRFLRLQVWNLFMQFQAYEAEDLERLETELLALFARFKRETDNGL